MNIDNLQVGMEIKNYKKLCEILEVEEKRGKGRDLQFKKFNDYFDYQKNGHKIIINKINSNEEVNHKKISKSRKTVYGYMIEVLLLNILASKGGNVIISKSSLSRELGLTNDNYKIGYNNQTRYSGYLRISNKAISDFYNINNSNINNIINTALNSLSDRSIIVYDTVVMVKYKDKRIAHKAHANDKIAIMEVEKQCMNEFGLNKKDEIRNLSTVKRKKYENRKNQLLQDNTNIHYSYKAYDILVSERFIEMEKKKITDYVLKEIDRQKVVWELNSTYSNNAISNAKNRYEKNKNKYNNDYVEIFKKLVNEFLYLEADKINASELFNLKNEIVVNSSDLPF